MQVVPESYAHVLRYRSLMPWTGELISARRNALGLTQAQLAERVGASLRAVTSWEANDSQPQRKFRAALDRTLGPPEAGSDPSRSVDLSTLSNSQIVVLMAQLAAEVGIRLDEAHGEPAPASSKRAADTLERTRGSKYYPADELARPNLREYLGPYVPPNDERKQG